MARAGRSGVPSGPAGQRDRLRAVVEAPVRRAGYDLEDVRLARVAGRRQVQIVVDGDSGVDSDAVARIAREVSVALDAADVVGAGPYDLEVSSPGIDRPLTQPRHWRRNRGRLVKVKAAEQALTGRVQQVDSDGVTLEVDGQPRSFRFDELGAGKVQVEFNRPHLEDDGLDLEGQET